MFFIHSFEVVVGFGEEVMGGSFVMVGDDGYITLNFYISCVRTFKRNAFTNLPLVFGVAKASACALD